MVNNMVNKIVKMTVVIAVIGVMCAYLYVTLKFALMRTALVQSATMRDMGWILRNVHDGDVVFFASRDPKLMTRSIGVYLKTCFYHVGIVVHVGGEMQLMHFIEPHHRAIFQGRALEGCPADGLCVSNMDVFLRAHGVGTVVAIMTPVVPQDGATLVTIGRSIACGVVNATYDTDFVGSYVRSMLFKINARNLHCNTFVGLLLERIGILPVERNPTQAYIPGATMHAMKQSGAFHDPEIVLVALVRDLRVES